MAQEFEQVQPLVVDVADYLNDIKESFLGPRLVVEAFSHSDMPKMCLYRVVEQSTILLSCYGINQPEPSIRLDAPEIQSGYYIQNPIMISGENFKILPLGINHCIAIPHTISVSPSVEEELHRIGELSDNDPVNAGLSYPLEAFTSVSAHELVSHGAALNMKTISLFSIDFSAIASFVSRSCPLSIAHSLVVQLGQFGQSLLSGIGTCKLLSNNRIFFAQYGRLPGDPELVSVQICKAYTHALATPEMVVKATGPYATISIAGDAITSAETEIKTFTNGLGSN